MAYRRAGRGLPLVLLHGFAADSRAWRPQLAALSASFDVIAWDAPGAGASADPPQGFTIADWADDLAVFMTTLHVDAADVLGISWGGFLAQELYRRHPTRVRSLVLADTYAGWRGSLSDGVAEGRLAAALHDAELGPDEFARRMLPSMFGSAAAAAARGELGRIMSGFHGHGFRLMATALAEADTRDLLPTVTVPTLLIWGEEDARSPVEVARAFRDAIPGSRLVMIPGAGHVTNLENAEAFNRHVRAFLLALDD